MIYKIWLVVLTPLRRKKHVPNHQPEMLQAESPAIPPDASAGVNAATSIASGSVSAWWRRSRSSDVELPWDLSTNRNSLGTIIF